MTAILVIESMNTVILDFDTYAVTKWNNIFMLNLIKLAADGYQVTECKWYKITSDEHIQIGTGLSYSSGDKISDKFDGTYRFVLTSDKGILTSTEKLINITKTLAVYPNPVTTNGTIILEGISEGSMIEVFSQSGTLVMQSVATGSPVTLTPDVSPGIYIIRTERGEIRINVKNN
jgi:hypothetical protein